MIDTRVRTAAGVGCGAAPLGLRGGSHAPTSRLTPGRRCTARCPRRARTADHPVEVAAPPAELCRVEGDHDGLAAHASARRPRLVTRSSSPAPVQLEPATRVAIAAATSPSAPTPGWRGSPADPLARRATARSASGGPRSTPTGAKEQGGAAGVRRGRPRGRARWLSTEHPRHDLPACRRPRGWPPRSPRPPPTPRRTRSRAGHHPARRPPRGRCRRSAPSGGGRACRPVDGGLGGLPDLRERHPDSFVRGGRRAAAAAFHRIAPPAEATRPGPTGLGCAPCRVSPGRLGPPRRRLDLPLLGWDVLPDLVGYVWLFIGLAGGAALHPGFARARAAALVGIPVSVITGTPSPTAAPASSGGPPSPASWSTWSSCTSSAPPSATSTRSRATATSAGGRTASGSRPHRGRRAARRAGADRHGARRPLRPRACSPWSSWGSSPSCCCTGSTGPAGSTP